MIFPMTAISRMQGITICLGEAFGGIGVCAADDNELWIATTPLSFPTLHQRRFSGCCNRNTITEALNRAWGMSLVNGNCRFSDIDYQLDGAEQIGACDGFPPFMHGHGCALQRAQRSHSGAFAGRDVFTIYGPLVALIISMSARVSLFQLGSYRFGSRTVTPAWRWKRQLCGGWRPDFRAFITISTAHIGRALVGHGQQPDR